MIRDWLNEGVDPDEPDTDPCEECGGEGRIPNYHGTGDQAGGYADTCEACNGTGVAQPVEPYYEGRQEPDPAELPY